MVETSDMHMHVNKARQNVLLHVVQGCSWMWGTYSQSNLEHVINCNQDVSAHLRRYHLSKECLSECDLILLRAGFLNIWRLHN